MQNLSNKISFILFFLMAYGITYSAYAQSHEHQKKQHHKKQYQKKEKMNGAFLSSINLKDGSNLEYVVRYPKEFLKDKKTKKRFPLLVFLHGGIYDDLGIENAAYSPVLKEVAKGRELPYFIVAPYNPEKKNFWDEADVKELIDHVMDHHNIDDNRVYIAGLSRGALGAWNMVMQYPDTFAALIAVSGAALTPYAVWIDNNMPIWVFHGVDDKMIPVEESVDMVKHLRSRGSKVKLTLYPNVEHNAWDRAYATDELYEWLDKQNREDWVRAEK